MNPTFLKRRWALTALAASALTLHAQAQTSDTWPSRPITLVVASAAGSFQRLRDAGEAARHQ